MAKISTLGKYTNVSGTDTDKFQLDPDIWREVIALKHQGANSSNLDFQAAYNRAYSLQLQKDDIMTEAYRRSVLGDPTAINNNPEQDQIRAALMASLTGQPMRLPGGPVVTSSPAADAARAAKMTYRKTGPRDDYSKAAAFSDADMLMQNQMRKSLETAMPGVTKGVESAGAVNSSVYALLTAQAAQRAAESSAALGADQAYKYGTLQSNEHNLDLEYAKLADKQENDRLKLLTGMLSSGGGGASYSSSSGHPDVNDPAYRYEALRRNDAASRGALSNQAQQASYNYILANKQLDINKQLSQQAQALEANKVDFSQTMARDQQREDDAKYQDMLKQLEQQTEDDHLEKDRAYAIKQAQLLAQYG